MGTTDAGHLGNLTGFNQLINTVKGYPETYNPSNENYKVNSLEAKALAATNQFVNYQKAESGYKVAIEHRQAVYEPLDQVITRSFNHLKSSGVTKMTVEEVAQIVRKLKGKRAGKKLSPAPKSPEQLEQRQNSVAQLSFDERLSNFYKYILQLQLIPQYQPNQPDLQLNAMMDYYTRMDGANKAALKAKNDLSNSRIARNKELYERETGLTELGRGDKLYIKSVFGAKSPEYQQVSGIVFRSYKN